MTSNGLITWNPLNLLTHLSSVDDEIPKFIQFFLHGSDPSIHLFINKISRVPDLLTSLVIRCSTHAHRFSTKIRNNLRAIRSCLKNMKT